MTGRLVDAAYYNQLSACNGALKHSGDSLKGEKEGADEVIEVVLDKLTAVNAVVFVLSAFSGGSLKTCETSMVEIKLGETTLTTLSCPGSAKTGLIFFMLFKHPDTSKWNFSKILAPVSARHFAACINPMRKIVNTILDPGCITENKLSHDKTFQMEKGDNFILPADVDEICVGLGWTAKRSSLDLDASCVMLQDVDNDGDLDPVEVVYFGNKVGHGVHSSGDNMSGAGEGDDETLFVNFPKIPSNVTNLAFTVNIYSSGCTFQDITNSYVRLFNTKTQHEYCRFTLSNNSSLTKEGVVFAMLQRGGSATAGTGTGWSVLVLGEPCSGRTARTIYTTLWDSQNNAPAPPAQQSGGGDGCCVVA